MFNYFMLNILKLTGTRVLTYDFLKQKFTAAVWQYLLVHIFLQIKVYRLVELNL